MTNLAIGDVLLVVTRLGVKRYYEVLDNYGLVRTMLKLYSDGSVMSLTFLSDQTQRAKWDAEGNCYRLSGSEYCASKVSKTEVFEIQLLRLAV